MTNNSGTDLLVVLPSLATGGAEKNTIKITQEMKRRGFIQLLLIDGSYNDSYDFSSLEVPIVVLEQKSCCFCNFRHNKASFIIRPKIIFVSLSYQIYLRQ